MSSGMSNFILFANAWLSYFLLFLIFIAAMIVAGTVGVKIRRNKDAKAVLEEAAAGSSNENV